MKYRTIVADPPWPQELRGVNFGADDYRGIAKGGSKPRRDYGAPYATVSLDDIALLPVTDLADGNSHLYLWTTNQFLRASYDIAERWGFDVIATLVWKKPSTGFMGGQFLNDIEFVQFCRRGAGSSRGERVRTRLFEWPRDTGTARMPGRGHSAKPEAFLDMVESLHVGPYLELFARRNRLGWDTWGDEAIEHLEDLRWDEETAVLFFAEGSGV